MDSIYNKDGHREPPFQLYLMTTFIDEVGIRGPRLGNTSVLLLTICFHRACPQYIFFLCSPNRNSALRALSIHMPQLSDWSCSLFRLHRHLVLTKKPLWMETRSSLQPSRQIIRIVWPQISSQKLRKHMRKINRNGPGFCGLWEKGDQKLAGLRWARSQWYPHLGSVESSKI